MSRCFVALVWLTAGAVGLASNTLLAAPKKEAKVSGTIKGLQGGVLVVETTLGEKWGVAVHAKSPMDVSYKGTAEASWLKPGTPVRFTTKFNVKMVGQEPVTELTVYNGQDYGIREEGAIGETALFGETPKKPERKKPAPVDPTAITAYTVQGQLKSLKNGKMMISAGAKSISCDLAEDAKINVEVNSIVLAQDGDTLEVTKAWEEGNRLATAEDAKITGVKPLVGKTLPKPLISTKPSPAEKPETEKKPTPEKSADAEKKPGFQANPLFNAK